ncbi:hypothetical protein [Paenarthrobacter sp. PH39-S1]|uniref:hypothetical protein n=1 Tax=Paenarthrobacter sp. PH39-S1 TaxID=3046204 RepID=UPI0024BA4DDC|nr:hypothetical protein [Paenarthrobacter sp. PH39-S1]MDJ0354953.1 hypothetical protein [Paenarthrobacter sp. PH39-S1]
MSQRPALIGLPLLITGFRAGAKARAFNRADFALAESLDQELGELYRRPAADAYQPDSTSGILGNATVIELERHFDQDTAGNMAGTLDHQFSMFSRSTGFSVGGVGGSGLPLLRHRG